MYNNLVALQRYEARVFCRRRIHGDRFPFPADSIREDAVGRDGPVERLREALYAVSRRSRFLRRAVEAFDPDLLHAHFGVDGVYALPIASRLDRPLAVSVYGYDITRLPRFHALPVAWLHYWLHFTALVERTARFIAYTEFLAGRLRERGVPADRITVHYSGIPVERYAVEVPNERRPPNILFVGRFVEKKGIDDLVQAFARLARQLPRSRLILVGAGPLEAAIRRRIAELGLGDRVDLPGFVAQADLREWFARAAVFCHPSVTTPSGETEGNPFATLEAQAAGLPVVATRHAGLPEGISDGATGLLVEERDVGGLVEALGALVQDEPRRAVMSRAAVTHVRERFDVRRQASLLEGIYDDILTTAT